jgi:superfamily II DNA or RNA helicase
MTFQLVVPEVNRSGLRIAPGARLRIRNTTWRATKVERDGAANFIHCVGLSGITKGKSSIFIDRLEPDLKVLDPADVELTADNSSSFLDTRLYLEAAFRAAPPPSQQPLVLGKAAIDDLEFQHAPVLKALSQSRIRLLIADDVGLGKTLEAGLVASELILRHRADRILVVSTRAMLTQFQKEFWTRFSIPLARLDGPAIKRMRNSIPSNYNVFDQFDRAIVSIDTLKKDLQYRVHLESSRWDLIIIDEAHNVATRKQATGGRSQRARLAQLLARRADALLLLTATPHDGSADSFSSLIEMLDGTRVPDPHSLRREDIEDLVIRRFRSSPDVQAQIGKRVPIRAVHRRDFPLSQIEDAAYNLVADLRLDLDEELGGKRRGLDLFRVTLAKALFSSPAACLETVDGRVRRIKAGQAKGSDNDITTLMELAALLKQIGPEDFTKYQALLRVFNEAAWNGKNARDRVVIFSERIATLNWLKARLAHDLGLAEDAIAKVDGSSVETDDSTQKVLEDFGQEASTLRILLASDMASEGLNLHFQCHRLIHFDLPWSLLRFQQRNGRIDRYGQKDQPQIHYFIGESSHPRVRDMWVLDKLVEKDEAAKQGIGDPAVFLGAGSIEGEELVVADAIAGAIGGKAFDAQMTERANAASEVTATDDWALLFGAYDEAPLSGNTHVPTPPPALHLYPDTFSFASAMLKRLMPDAGNALKIDGHERLIDLELPDDLKANDAFGYRKVGEVDDRFMPVEAVASGSRIQLTDRNEVVNQAVVQARADERAWPSVQYLWDVHPIMGWLRDRADTLFPEGSAPLCSLTRGVEKNEIAALMHASIPNYAGQPTLDLWAVVRLKPGERPILSTDVASFLKEAGLMQETPNRGAKVQADLKPLLKPAISAFQDHVVAERKARQLALDETAEDIRSRLSAFRNRFDNQLKFQFGESDDGRSPTGTSRQASRDAEANRIAEMFRNWEAWIDHSCRLAEDANPHVDLKAVFRG